MGILLHLVTHLCKHTFRHENFEEQVVRVTHTLFSRLRNIQDSKTMEDIPQEGVNNLLHLAVQLRMHSLLAHLLRWR